MSSMNRKHEYEESEKHPFMELFREPRGKFNIGLITFLFVFWVFVMILPPFCITDCVRGHKWAAHIVFMSLIVILGVIYLSLFIYLNREAIVFRYCKHYYSTKSDKFWYFYSAMAGIFGHVDIYTDLCFITIAYDADATTIFQLALIVFLASNGLKIFTLGTLVYRIVTNTELKDLEIYKLFNYHELLAISFIAKYDMRVIDTLQSEITFTMYKFCTEDLLQVVLQLIYITNDYCETGQGSLLIAFSISIAFLFSIASLVRVCIKKRYLTPADKYLNGEKASRLNRGQILQKLVKEELIGIAETLKYENTDITKLNIQLSPTVNSEEVARKLAEAFQTTTNVKTLAICGCDINDRTLNILQGGLVKNSSIETISLDTNNITDEGVTQIRIAYRVEDRSDKPVPKLYIGNNNLSEDIPSKIEERNLVLINGMEDDLNENEINVEVN